jgi:hypothetical protein
MLAAGVGHNPNPLSSVRRAGIVSTHHERPAGVTKRLQVAEDEVSSATPQAGHILADDPLWAQFSDEAGILGPEVSRVVGAFPFTGKAPGLAWKSSNNTVNCAASGHNVNCLHASDILPPRHIWPVFRQHALAERVNLNLPGAGPSSALTT